MASWIRVGTGLSLLLVLTGCLAARNLAVPGNGLPLSWAQVAQNMVEVASKTCIKVNGYDHIPKSEWQKGIALTEGWSVVRFYASDTPWVKADAVAHGIFDEVFFHTQTRQLVCGSYAWSQFKAGQSVQFHEVVPQRP